MQIHNPVEHGNGPVLRLDNVTAGYKGVDVLRGVTLCVARSAVVALLGPNGAGKTTALRYASGMLRGRTGRLYVDGRDITDRPAHHLARAGLCHIPEGRGIYPSLTVRENISMSSPRIAPDDLVDSAISAFPHLKSRLKQPAGTLSGGEQQMLALSRAYAGSPNVVLLDEVSMGLAPKIVDEIFSSIGQLRSRNVSLLLVEQYVDRALEIADYVYVLKRGTIRAEGPAATFTRERIFDSYLGGEPSSDRHLGPQYRRKHKGALKAWIDSMCAGRSAGVEDLWHRSVRRQSYCWPRAAAQQAAAPGHPAQRRRRRPPRRRRHRRARRTSSAMSAPSAARTRRATSARRTRWTPGRSTPTPTAASTVIRSSSSSWMIS
jgi:branched-chain amino acid transport system ATP-binding protein